jgi:hypothetical protein
MRTLLWRPEHTWQSSRQLDCSQPRGSGVRSHKGAPITQNGLRPGTEPQAWNLSTELRAKVRTGGGRPPVSSGRNKATKPAPTWPGPTVRSL